MIVDVGLGNVGAVQNILQHIGVECFRSSNFLDLMHCSKVILPGVGSFDAGVKALRKNNLFEPLQDLAFRGDTPLLGICLGMQLLLGSSEEGIEEGLCLIRGSAQRFKITDPKIKVPHMGWNYSIKKRPSCLMNAELKDPRFYFTHSYHAVCDNPENIVATTFYGYDFPSIIQHKNVFGVQFHPEKSHRYGMTLLSEFSKII